MIRFAFSALLLAAIQLASPGGDKTLEGKWRSAKPEQRGDDTTMHEYEFFGDGSIKINKIEYKWNPVNKSFAPINATMLCAGDNDHYKTENGYILMSIRESYITFSNLELRYRVKEDTLWIWEAEVFRGNNSQLTGEWSREDMEEENPNKKQTAKMSFEPNGKVLIEKFGQKAEMDYFVNGSRIEFSSQAVDYSMEFEIFPKSLCLYKPETMIKLVRKKPNK